MPEKQHFFSVSHPGTVLFEKYMKPRGITVQNLAEETGLSPFFLDLIVKGEYPISSYAAGIFARKFSTKPSYWLDMQDAYDAEYTKAVVEKNAAADR